MFTDEEGFQWCNYSAMAALAFTLWDISITTADEVEQIWRKPWSFLKLTYLFIRYFSPIAQIMSTVITLGLAARPVLTKGECMFVAGFQGIASQMLMLGVQIILILRVRALYHDPSRASFFVDTLLRGLFVLEFALMTTLFGLAIPQIEYGPHCVVTAFPSVAIGFLLAPILFESLLFSLTMAKFYRSVKDGWGRETVLARFIQDGIWAFLLPFVFLTVNTCCMALLKGAISSVAYSWLLAIPPFAGYRLVLNMSHLLTLNERYRPSAGVTNPVLVDTIPELTQPFETYDCTLTTDLEMIDAESYQSRTDLEMVDTQSFQSRPESASHGR
ncbi:hypothetical protein HGRIS_007476 [Hohenbuehelia grisea]|uniref:DUF6533 domain-containing protein n=1 Tax=Hohenbuehelia grisea TaxID=104357 RepID=A0ABR3J4Y3_9AGAR